MKRVFNIHGWGGIIKNDGIIIIRLSYCLLARFEEKAGTVSRFAGRDDDEKQ